MKTIYFVLVVLISMCFISCEDKRITAYKKIIDQTARFKIHFLFEKKPFFLGQNEIERFKQALISEIQPDTLSSFIADTRIEFIDSNFQQIGAITIVHNNKPTANFKSENLNFGFRLHYRVGMWISELRHKH